MTIEQLRTVQQATPFRPYILQLADGDRMVVRHPELVLITPGGRTIAVATSADAVKIIDLLLVTAIDIPKNHRRTRALRQTR
jgi:hypothetical protein